MHLNCRLICVKFKKSEKKGRQSKGVAMRPYKTNTPYSSMCYKNWNLYRKLFECNHPNMFHWISLKNSGKKYSCTVDYNTNYVYILTVDVNMHETLKIRRAALHVARNCHQCKSHAITHDVERYLHFLYASVSAGAQTEKQRWIVFSFCGVWRGEEML